MEDWTAREDNDEKEGRGREVEVGEGGRGGEERDWRGEEDLSRGNKKRKEKSWKRWADGTG